MLAVNISGSLCIRSSRSLPGSSFLHHNKEVSKVDQHLPRCVQQGHNTEQQQTCSVSSLNHVYDNNNDEPSLLWCNRNERYNRRDLGIVHTVLLASRSTLSTRHSPKATLVETQLAFLKADDGSGEI